MASWQRWTGHSHAALCYYTSDLPRTGAGRKWRAGKGGRGTHMLLCATTPLTSLVQVQVEKLASWQRWTGHSHAALCYYTSDLPRTGAGREWRAGKGGRGTHMLLCATTPLTSLVQVHELAKVDSHAALCYYTSDLPRTGAGRKWRAGKGGRGTHMLLCATTPLTSLSFLTVPASTSSRDTAEQPAVCKATFPY